MPNSQSLTLQEFVDTIINAEPLIQNPSRLLKKMEELDCYRYDKIFIKIQEMIGLHYLPENYAFYYQNNNINNNSIKLLLFLRYKTPKQLYKYIKLLPQHRNIFMKYIDEFNKYYNQYISKQNLKYILPPVLRKIPNYNITDIRHRIIQNIGDTNNEFNFDFREYIKNELNFKTVKDCISMRCKLKKDTNYFNKVIIKLEQEYREHQLNYTEPDRAYILDEMQRNIESIRNIIGKNPLKIRAINEYMEIISADILP